MKRRHRIILLSISFLLAAFMVWYFSTIVFYVLTAAVLSIIGHPLVRLFDRIHIGKVKMPHTLSSTLALFTLIAFFTGLLAVFIPLIIAQMSALSEIDPIVIREAFHEPLRPLETFLMEHGMIEQDLASLVETKLVSILKVLDISSILDNIIAFTGSVFIAVFSIVFLTFFFLKDEGLFARGVLSFVPDEYVDDTRHIMIESRRLLTRYFIGIGLEILIMMTLISIGVSLTGLKNALLIGVIGGFMNVIPYLGPLIGGAIGIVIGITTNLTPDNVDTMGWMAISIAIAFSIPKLIDDFILQPTIYSSSVRAHPIEIFLVILMAGSLAGILGMILAIPAYTVLRVVAKQFFGKFKIVNTLTRNL
jgi:predicted PurR-regulated permease PerM